MIDPSVYAQHDSYVSGYVPQYFDEKDKKWCNIKADFLQASSLISTTSSCVVIVPGPKGGTGQLLALNGLLGYNQAMTFAYAYAAQIEATSDNKLPKVRALHLRLHSKCVVSFFDPADIPETSNE